MSDLSLTKVRMRNGVWEGRISGAGDAGAQPDIRVTYLDAPVETLKLTQARDPGVWDLAIEIPKHAIGDGVQTFLIIDGSDDTKLGDVTLIAGEAVADDLRAEVELLRAELDMLKRAFRRHCLETM